MSRGGVFGACLPKGAVDAISSRAPPLDMHRSAPMSLLQLYVPLEAAQTTLSELGEQGLVQFRDLNGHLAAHQRHFTSEIVQLSETERKIVSLRKASEATGVVVKAHGLGRVQPKTHQELLEMDRELGAFEERITQMSDSVGVLEGKLADLEEYRAALLQVSQILTGGALSMGVSEEDVEGGGGVGELVSPTASTHSYHQVRTGKPSSLAGFVVGVMPKRKFNAFERVMWRAMRGNVHIGKSDLPVERGFCSESSVEADVVVGGEVAVDARKVVFVVFAHGSTALAKIQRICQVLGCHLYPEVDDDVNRRAQQLSQVSAQIEDLSNILYNTKLARRAEAGKIVGELEEQLTLVRHQLGLYAVMNLLQYDVGGRCLIGEAWCPLAQVGKVDEALRRAGERAGLDVSSIMTVLKTEMTPPTHFPRNKFTAVFVDMTEAYGIANYREANPALSMIVTFPFFFAVMFGDVGHAMVLLLMGAWMVLAEKKLERQLGDSELGGMIFHGRYIVLLMGLFSVYAGLIYNDCFSKSLALFPSMFSYDWASGASKLVDPDYVYPFGVDPLWNHAINHLNMINSIKMKGAIIIAVLHMGYGMVLNALNFVFERDWAGLLCCALPKILFYSSLFGYMAFMMVYKWCVGVDVSVLSTFITMIMGFGSVDEKFPLYSGQETVQSVLMVLAVITLPLMIFGRAGLMVVRRRRIEAQGYHEASRHGSVTSFPTHSPSMVISIEGVPGLARKSTPATNVEAKESASDVLMSDAIHAVEFLLGSVSNTASYLRLWALSLAHAQLSEVLWTFCLEACAGNAIALVVGYAMFFILSMALMVGLEGLSAFLHALRLHWVEFNNKFYGGAGIKFEPFQLDPYTGRGVVIAAEQPPEEK